MAASRFDRPWHGIPRREIAWYPTIHEEKCIGCSLCYVSCGREVFSFDDQRRKAVVAQPYNCMVGCTTCATICPTEAIEFPSREMIQNIEKEHKILRMVRQTAKAKKSKEMYNKARAEAEKLLLKVVTRIEIEATGHFGERGIIAKLYEVIREEPCDILYMIIETPTLKGCWNERAPSYCKFQLVSTEYAD